MIRLRRLLRWALALALAAVVLGLAGIGVLYWLIAPTLPDVQGLKQVELQVPLRVLSREGKLIAVFGEMRRTPVEVADVPEQLKRAFIAIEDARFYEHPGVDWRGVARAVWLLATTDDRRVPGGSTITQQVARQFFLSSEYSYTRKLTEMFLAFKMERELSKDEILGLYLNKSFFGNRAYGIVAAAEFYYGKPLDELSLAECAMLASIPKFPSSANPLSNPARALVRRDYVLQRMHEVGFIDEASMRAAQAEPDRARPHEPAIEVEATFVAEMIRLQVTAELGAEALTGGYVAHTTLAADAQNGANTALRAALLDYDRRHGWRGPEARLELPPSAGTERIRTELEAYSTVGGLVPGVVTGVLADRANVLTRDGQDVELGLAAMAWAAPYLSENSRGPRPTKVDQVLKRGDVVRLIRNAEGDWELSQVPKAQGALVAISPEDGSVRSLVGGFSFALNKFNRAVQAQRQPGSSFKPFVYAAAFERGFTPASIVLDAPVVFHDRGSNSTWRPQNDNQTFAGPMRLRDAMVSSRNLVSVRVLDAVGASYAHRFVQSFGFPPESLPQNLSLALGTNSASPLAMARGFAAFANGGYLVEPFVLERVEDRRGEIVYQASPVRACARCPERLAERGGRSGGFNLGPSRTATKTGDDEPGTRGALAPRALDERTAFLINSLLRDVVRRGTGSGARVLGRGDLGGKTGTTNDYRDAWFSGFGGDLVATAWVGMDDFSSLGRREFASRAALPMWTDFMRVALRDVAEVPMSMPDGVVTAMIDPETGLLAGPDTPGALPELFRAEDIGRLEERGLTQTQRQREQEAFEIF
jgi:penicillin-binding protein 1A